MSEKKIWKIVLTGGPCAGKSTAVSRLRSYFTEHGYRVLIVPEIATILIGNGITHSAFPSNGRCEYNILRLQKEMEDLYMDAAAEMKDDKILIICDRGMMDIRAYLTKEEFKKHISSLGLTEIQMRDRYDGIFHLVTAADGAVEFYTLENNEARRETPEEAIAADRKLSQAWTGHPHLRIIGNETDFENKINNLINAICNLLGEEGTEEIRKKYLIKYPDTEKLFAMPQCHKVQIVQTYLRSDDSETVSIRCRGYKEDMLYFKTAYRKLPDGRESVKEEVLSEEAYYQLMPMANPSVTPIVKDRYCLVYDHRYFEIDVFAGIQDIAILRTQKGSEDEEITFPEGIEVLRDVTDDENYRSYHLAEKV